MTATPVTLGARADTTTSCLAPSVHMYLAPNGDVRACCRNWDAIGNVAEASLTEIWQGTLRRRLIDALAAGRFPGGCGQCGAEIQVEGRAAAYPSNFDQFASDEGLVPAWPSRLEFNMSNVCNLMCIQCDGFLSSMIRLHREGLPPMPKVYGDEFFADLEHFIPHLQEAQFAGGEPFLARESYRAWDLIERLRPDLDVWVVTNATQWNDRVERVGRALRMGYTFSIDGITRSTYEHIRINSDFDAVMRNIKRFRSMAKDRGTACEVNFCLMPQNLHELGELLMWADSLQMEVNVCVVRAPQHASVPAMPPDELRAAADLLERQDASVSKHLGRNKAVWDTEVARVGNWARAATSDRRKLWWSSEWWSPERHPKDSNWYSSLGLQTRECVVTTDVDTERNRLRSMWPDRTIHEMTLDYRPDADDDHRIVALSDSVGEFLDDGGERLHGRPPADLPPAVEPRFGTLVDIEVIDGSGERGESEAVYERARIRTIVVPHPDDDGDLASVTLLMVVHDSESTVPQG